MDERIRDAEREDEMADDLARITGEAKRVSERFSLSGRKALVVGGSKGLGQSMALALAGVGAEVCVASRDRTALKETEAALREVGSANSAASGAAASSFQADVTHEDQVEAMVRHMAERHGGLDILVNSQGTVVLQPSTEFSLDAWQGVMDVNLKSLVLCCKHAGRVMLEKGYGKIINISSVRGFQGRAQDMAYAPSKGAVNQLTRSLAIEWGPKGINVNGIAPVFTVTAMAAEFLSDPKRKEWVMSRIPMKRLGQLEDLMGPIIFLASGASDFVNGHTLPVDGGWLSA